MAVDFHYLLLPGSLSVILLGFCEVVKGPQNIFNWSAFISHIFYRIDVSLTSYLSLCSIAVYFKQLCSTNFGKHVGQLKIQITSKNGQPWYPRSFPKNKNELFPLNLEDNLIEYMPWQRMCSLQDANYEEISNNTINVAFLFLPVFGTFSHG